jgi:hypothetical protein
MGNRGESPLNRAGSGWLHSPPFPKRIAVEGGQKGAKKKGHPKVAPWLHSDEEPARV